MLPYIAYKYSCNNNIARVWIVPCPQGILTHIRKKETVIMAATKICPYCHNEIADGAILCKYCHNLLIGGNQDIESAVNARRERRRRQSSANASNAVDEALGLSHSEQEEYTREFSALDAADYQEKTRAFSVPKQPQQQPPLQQEPVIHRHTEEPVKPRFTDAPVQTRHPQAAAPNDSYYDDGYYGEDDQYYDDGYYDDNDRYYDEDGYYDGDDYYDDYYDDQRRGKGANSQNDGNSRKKIFLITAGITLGILALIALAVFVGYKLVGFAKNDSSSSSIGKSTTSSITTATKATEQTTTTTKATEETTKKTSKETEATTEQTTEQTFTQPTQDTKQTEDTKQTQDTKDTQDTKQTEDTKQTQQSSSVDQVKVMANVAQALTAYDTSGIQRYEYRTEDPGAVYFYVYTNDNHAYSVAYFKESGRSRIVKAW